jgi:hypothetical protein
LNFSSFRHSQFRLHLAALIFFAGLAFLAIYPLIFHNGTQVAGFDFFNYNWNFWWVRHALTTPGLQVYASNFALFPAMSDYGYHALTLVWFPLWALLEPLLGTLTVMNVIITLVCILNGYLMFVLLRCEGVAPGLALLGGAALQISPILRYFYYNTHINLMDWFWLPVHLLLWQQIVRAVEAGKLRRAILWAILQGIGLWGVLLSDLQFPIFVAFLLVPYIIYMLWKTRQRFKIIAVGLVVNVVALPLAWFLGPLPFILHFSGTLAPGTVEDRPGIPPLGFLTMSKDWWVWSAPSLGAFVTIAVIVTLIAALRHRKRIKERWLWFVLMLPPLLLALGPNLTIAAAAIPLPPFRLLYNQTNGMFKMPWRLAPIYLIAALIFIGQSWTPRFRRAGTTRLFVIAGLLLLLALDVRLMGGGPLEPAPTDYAFYHQIGQEQGDPYDHEVVLEVPNGVGTGEVLLGDPRAVQLQYYGMIHHKRMVNGFVSRTPTEDFWYMLTDDPLLSWLGQRRYLEPDKVEPELRDHIFNWPIGYIVVHQDLIGRDSSTDQEVLGYLNSLRDLLCPVAVEKDAVFYRTAWHPDGCPPRIPPQTDPGVYTIDIGSSGDEAYIGWGWHYQESVSGLTLRWTGEYPQTQVYFDLPPGAYNIILSAQAFAETRHLRLLINDTPLAEPVPVTVDSLHNYTFPIPATLVGGGKHLKLTLDYDAVVVPADVGQSADTRKLAVAVDWIRFTRTDQAMESTK